MGAKWLLIIQQIRQMRPKDRSDKTAVVVGTVTDDLRILEVPKLKVCLKQHLYIPIVVTKSALFCITDLCAEGDRGSEGSHPEGWWRGPHI